jgi:hypothetical protein
MKTTIPLLIKLTVYIRVGQFISVLQWFDLVAYVLTLVRMLYLALTHIFRYIMHAVGKQNIAFNSWTISLSSIFIFLFFYFHFSHGVRLSPLSTAATVWPIVPAPDDRWRWLWNNRRNVNWQGKPNYSEKTCLRSTLSTTHPTLPDPS